MDDGSSSNSSSSESSTSSISSSASSSSGSESSSGEEKSMKNKTANNMNTRRKSSETKSTEKPPTTTPTAPASTKRPSTTTNNTTTSNANSNPRVLRNNTASSDDESPSLKKTSKVNLTAAQKRKLNATNSPNTPANATATSKNQQQIQQQQQQQNQTSNEKVSSNSSKTSTSNNLKNKSRTSNSKVTEDDSEKEQKVSTTQITASTTSVIKSIVETKPSNIAANKKASLKAALKTINPAIAANKPKATRNKQSGAVKKSPVTKKEPSPKSSDDSESESESDSDEESSTSSESEATASSNSYSSHGAKASKNKRTPSKNNNNNNNKTTQSDSEEDETTPRKLTRSFSNRVNKQMKKEISHTESTTEGEEDKVVKNPVRKAALTNGVTTKNRFKKETNGPSTQQASCIIQPRIMSPPCLVEKKCPIEGCDSSGHLSGNLERHFLPEACPMYHNMSASECKERANERKIRNEARSKTDKAISHNSASTSQKNLTAEQKEFLAKIHSSRAKFKPVATTNSTEKVKVEKDFTEEGREPNLNGFVPDYDLQMFREAQAIAAQKIESEIKDLPVGKGIKYITMGKYKMKVWYQSPYPDDAARLPQMYICEFCLRYQKSETSIKRHAQKCVWRHPPGDEIYRKGKLQVWQVDGKRQKQYCQHLCLLAKFFLDHKTLYYDVEPFLFYIMTLADVDGCHTVGYFSKEKNSFYNVSCILTLPPYQRKGYGRLLIDFSYLLTRVEGKIGSPEKPLSDLGLISYRSYWKDVLLDYLCNRSGNTLSIKDVSQEMAIYSYDIVSTLQALGMMKYWKGKHIVLKKQDVLDEYAERVRRRGTFPKIDEACLRWKPFVPTQNNDSG